MFNDDFGGNFDNFFDLVSSVFNAPVKDMYPYHVYLVKDKGLVIVCKTLGIAKENISVRLDKEKGAGYPILRVTGATENKKINFTNKVDLSIQLKLDADRIESLQYDVKDGLTTVYIKLKQNKPERSIEAKYVDGPADIDW